MSNLVHIAEQLKGMSSDLADFEQDMAQTERQRLDYERSTDRIPELIAEAKLLSKRYGTSYAVVRSTTGTFHLIAASSGLQKDFIELID